MALEKKSYGFEEITKMSTEAFARLQTDRGAVFNVPAAMSALAWVESAGVVNARGDGGSSWGLWQINSKVWPIGSREEDFKTFFGQVPWAIIVAEDALQTVAWAFDNRRFRKDQAQQIVPTFNPPIGSATDVWAAIVFGLVWQFGSPSVRDWIIKTTDHTLAGFKKYRSKIERPVPRSYDRRQKTYVDRYQKGEKLIQDHPLWWPDFMKPYLKDIKEAPGKFFGWFEEKAKAVTNPWKLWPVLAVVGLYFLSPLIRTGAKKWESRS